MNDDYYLEQYIRANEHFLDNLHGLQMQLRLDRHTKNDTYPEKWASNDKLYREMDHTIHQVHQLMERLNDEH